jgi:23S rRNA (guanosine2251-2'-O)-methyltransferase
MRTIYGLHPVRELVRAGAEGISELWIAEGSRGREVAHLERLARAGGAKVRAAPRAKLDRLAGTERHQGVVAIVADYRYRDVDDLLALARDRGEPPLLIVLDGIEDPQNLGAIVRSAHALGAHGVIVPKDRAAGVTAAVAKASAGAVEHCPIARVTNVAQSIESLKGSGIWSVAMAPDGDRALADVDLAGPTALVIGNEGEGIRPLVRRTCDYIAQIPMAGKVASLNAAASASIALYEAARQRGGHAPSPKEASRGETGGESRS